MDLRITIRNGISAAGICLGLSMAPAQAGTAGSIALDITGGCFAYGGTGCGNTDTSRLEYANGSFEFHNNLLVISNPATYAYQAAISLHAEAPGPGNTTLSFDYAPSRTFASLANLTPDPLWGMAYSFVNTVLSLPAGSFTATIPPAMGPFTASWNYLPNPGSTPISATGTFEAWSGDNLNGLSQLLFNQPLPASPVSFTLSVALNVIPEPAMIALTGLGMLGMGVIRKRTAPRSVRQIA